MNNIKQCRRIRLFGIIFLTSLLAACGNTDSESEQTKNNTHMIAADAEVIKGSRNGRLLNSGDFTLELAIFETGVPPEFRAWASFKNKPLLPTDVELNIISVMRRHGKIVLRLKGSTVTDEAIHRLS